MVRAIVINKYALRAITIVLIATLCLWATACRRQEKNVPTTFKTWEMDNDQLIEYFLSQTPAAKEMVEKNGMAVLVTGETTDIQDITCRDLWLGTNLKDKFTKEILYTIGPGGEVFEFDPLGCCWTIRNTRLAYVKIKEILGDGTGRILVDEAQWIDDDSKPNGYEIRNDAEEWVTYSTAHWTVCSVLVNVPDLGITLEKVNFDDFVYVLSADWREGVLLADIVTHGEHILSISERYTP